MTTDIDTTDTTDIDIDAEAFRLTIWHDDHPYDAPGSEDGTFRLYSFSTRHGSFKDPDEVLACTECGDAPGYVTHQDPEPEDADLGFDYHQYVPPVGFMLSYYEHTLVRWALAGTISHYQHFQWDGVSYAGFLAVNPDNDEGTAEWWDGLDEDRRREVAKNFLDEYTDWANGEIFGYTLVKVERQTCSLGFVHEDEVELEGPVGGYIGDQWLVDAVREELRYYNATEDNTEVVDKAFGATTYMKLFDVPVTE